MSIVSLPRWQVWFLAFRPWSFTASFIPVTLGSILAWQQGPFNLFLYLLALAGGVLLHAGTNAVNTYYDYLAGIDTVANKGKSQPFLVLGWLQPRELLWGGHLAFGLAIIIGCYLIALRGWLVLALGIIGLVGGYGYTARPLAYKYQGLGIPFVFILMGPLMVVGGYVVQTGSFGWLPVLASLPVGFLVAGILHANDLRDIEGDRDAAIKTLSHYLKDAAQDFYYFLIWGAYLSLALLAILKVLPWAALLPLLTLPEGFKLMRMVKGGFTDNPAFLEPVEPLTARLHLIFGLLLIIGLLLAGL
ncbi:MAG: 1,4-dihydroxy-2-naphthoate polyprenyltransferase [Clostridia bacterium]|nr:1,4-dihydroxy-2-naphthoate polyprenyltransferase [Clostridia bacterium]